MASMLTGASSRNAGQEAMAHDIGSRGREDDPLFGQRQAKVSNHVLGISLDGARLKDGLQVKDIVVGRSDDRRREPQRSGSRSHSLKPPWLQAGGICGATPLIATRRGFIASGISRTSTILGRPLSNVAALTWK